MRQNEVKMKKISKVTATVGQLIGNHSYGSHSNITYK